jgi:hypothetical protein
MFDSATSSLKAGSFESARCDIFALVCVGRGTADTPCLCEDSTARLEVDPDVGDGVVFAFCGDVLEIGGWYKSEIEKGNWDPRSRAFGSVKKFSFLSQKFDSHL